MLDSSRPISITPVIDAQRRDIDHLLACIKRQEYAMDRMLDGPRYRRAERDLNRLLDQLDDLNDEMSRTEMEW